MNVDSFSIATLDDAGPAPVVTVSGEIDIAAAPQLRQHLMQLVERPCKTIIVDLAEVQFMDSTGLNVFSAVRKRMQALDGRLILAGAQPPVIRLFQLSAMDRLFTIVGDREEAFALLSE